MPKKLTQKEFVERAESLSPDLDFSKSIYKNSTTPVTVVCKKHDLEFTMRPGKILQSQNGCPDCGGKRLTNEDFIRRSIKIHGEDKFDFSETVYTKMNEKVKIKCVEHDVFFFQNPQAFMKGFNGCTDCNGQKPIDRDEFIKRSKNIFGEDRFDYSKVSEIKGIHTKVVLICNIHNVEYIQEAWSNLNKMIGCYKCSKTLKMSKEVIIEKSFKVHSKKFDFSQVDWNKGIREKQTIGCSVTEHGFFTQTLDGLLMGKTGCNLCDKENRSTTLEEFIERVKGVHGENRYGFDKTVLKNSLQGDTVLKCNKHFEYFTYSIFRILQGLEGCKKCRTRNVSKKEKDLANFVKSLGFEVIENDREILNGKEIDVFIPDLNVGIEFNGLYWHSEKFKGRNFHKDKFQLAKNKNVRLLQIWEDEWDNKQDIVKSHIKHVLGVSSERVFARNTFVKVIEKFEASSFLDSYHIQGFVGSSVYLGLFDKLSKKLIAVAAFVKNKSDYTLTRYATCVHVVGGHSKIVKFFENNYEFERLVTFADLSFSDGGLYEKTGWNIDGIVPPDYSYVIGNKRFHKFGFRLSKFKNDPFLVFEEGLSERELAELNGFDRVWDSGKIRFVRAKS